MPIIERDEEFKNEVIRVSSLIHDWKAAYTAGRDTPRFSAAKMPESKLIAGMSSEYRSTYRR